MSVEQALVTRLETSAALVALVGTRIEPVVNAQSGTWPALSYQQISGPREHSHDGCGIQFPRFQLTATATTFTEAAAVMAAARAVLDGFGWHGYNSFCENQLDSYAPQAGERGVYIRRMDVVIWYGEL
jgi:hypothetical protein